MPETNGPIVIINMRYKKPEEEYEVRVDRASVLGNPFHLGRDGDRNGVCDKYETWFEDKIKPGAGDKEVQAELDRLQKIYEKYNYIHLCCWCAPYRCHAETIKKYLEGYFSYVTDEPCVDIWTDPETVELMEQEIAKKKGEVMEKAERTVHVSWAFGGQYEKKQEENNKTYEEIKDMADVQYVRSGYAHTVYRVVDNPHNLTDNELALIADSGNLCFGYRIEGNEIHIYTD